MTIKCAIIDDEPLAAEMLAGYASKTPFLNLVGVYNSAIEAIRSLRSDPVDLLFLDIQMPELSGLEFATILLRRRLSSSLRHSTAMPLTAIRSIPLTISSSLSLTTTS